MTMVDMIIAYTKAQLDEKEAKEKYLDLEHEIMCYLMDEGYHSCLKINWPKLLKTFDMDHDLDKPYDTRNK